MQYPEIPIQANPIYQPKRLESNPPIYEAGQLRRAKMHAARMIEVLDDKKVLTPSLYQLLETSIILETTDSKILAGWLKRTPAAVRSDLQKICVSLANYS